MKKVDNKKEEKTWAPTVLVLGPGGLKGLIQLGALAYFEKRGLLKQITTFAGCSVGAVICLLLAAGFSVDEIIAEAAKTAHLFQDLTSLHFQKMKEHTGLLDQEIFKRKLSDQLTKKFGFVPTLKQLYMMTGNTLVTVSLNMDRDLPVYFSHVNEPDLSCVEAVLLSMNIPFLFYKLRFKGELYIDGAFASPYPVDIFDDGKTDILGIHIATPIVSKDLDNSILLYFYKIIICAMTQLKKRIEQNSSSRCRHLELVSPSSDFTGVSMSIDTKAQMILNGYESAKEFYTLL